MTGRLMWYFGAPIVACFAIFFAVQDLEPAWRAFRGDGVPGTFTATREECTRSSCQWHGTFESDDGTLVRENMRLDAGPSGLRVGSRVRAFDVGSRVKVVGGGPQVDWLLVPLFVIGAVLVLAAWAGTIWLRLRTKVRGATGA